MKLHFRKLRLGIIAIGCLAGFPLWGAANYPEQAINIAAYNSLRNINLSGYANGSDLNTWVYNGETNGDWYVEYVSQGIFKIRNRTTGTYITQSDCKAVLDATDSDQNQEWKIEGVNQDFLGFNLYYKITNAGTGEALTYHSAGNYIALEVYTGAETQLWKLNLVGLEGFAANCKVTEGEHACTIGGLLGETVEVSTIAEFKAAVQSQQPQTVIVTDTLNFSSEPFDVSINSNKTIIGSYDNPKITDPRFRTNDQWGPDSLEDNIIFKNLNIEQNIKDKIAFQVYSSKNVWFDHCTFQANVPMDSAMADVGKFIWINTPYPTDERHSTTEVERSPDFVTLSYMSFHDRYWSVAYGTQNSKTNEDRTTVMFNEWEGCVRRMPQIGNGTMHEYCSYINRTHSSSDGGGLACIIIGDGATLYSENNRFQGLRKEDSGYTDDEILSDYGYDAGTYTDKQTSYVDGTTYTPYLLTHTFANPATWNPQNLYGYHLVKGYDANGLYDTKTFVSQYAGCQDNAAQYLYIMESAAKAYVSQSYTAPFLTDAGVTDVPTEATTLTKHGSGSSNQTLQRGDTLVPYSYGWTGASTVTVTGLPAGISADVDICAQEVYFSGTTNDVAGVYTFTLSTVGGNPDSTRTGTITLTDPTSIATIRNEKSGKVYAEGPYLKIESTATTGSTQTLSLYNSKGEKVFENTTGPQLQQTVGPLEKGIYLLTLQKDGGEETQKVIIH